MMILMMLGEDGAYTRRTDPLSKDIHRQKAKDTPIPLERFERLLLKAIQHYNLFTNKKRLRTAEQRKDGINLTPAKIWEDTQEQRRGDARRKLTPREVFERFVPWQSRTCRRGLVHFMSMRYSSDELVEHFNQHAQQTGKSNPLPVPVKRLDGKRAPPTLAKAGRYDRGTGHCRGRRPQHRNRDMERARVPQRARCRAGRTAQAWPPGESQPNHVEDACQRRQGRAQSCSE